MRGFILIPLALLGLYSGGAFASTTRANAIALGRIVLLTQLDHGRPPPPRAQLRADDLFPGDGDARGRRPRRDRVLQRRARLDRRGG